MVIPDFDSSFMMYKGFLQENRLTDHLSSITAASWWAQGKTLRMSLTLVAKSDFILAQPPAAHQHQCELSEYIPTSFLGKGAGARWKHFKEMKGN